MIRQTIKKSGYQSIAKLSEKLYRIMWNKEDETEKVYRTDADGNIVTDANGEPVVENEKETDFCTCVIENIRMPKNGSNIIDLIEKGKKVGYGEPSLDVWLAWVQGGNPFGFGLEELKNHVLDAMNKEIDQKILSGFVWKDMLVWLSSENQFNYKAAYDLAVMSQGKSLPITFKFGTTEQPVYYAFESLEDISDFYVSAMAYINTCLAEGWKLKDAIDWSVYEDVLNEPAEVQTKEYTEHLENAQRQ